jgi:LysR family positive regulator for ilvC
MKEYEPLRLFVHLSGSLNFGRTARSCYLSPSTLSRAIRRLEADVGAPLLERDQHHVRLTPAGAAFQRHAIAVLGAWEELQRELRREAGMLSGALHVYCTVTAAQSIVPALLSRFRQLHPDVRLELETGYAADALDRLADGVVDVTVAALPARRPAGLAVREVATTPVVFVAPTAPGPVSEAVDRRRVAWGSVPLVLPTHGLARTHVDAWFRAKGLTATIATEVQGHEAILSLVALGCGVGVVPRLVLEKSALRGEIRELDVRPRLPQFRIGVCVRRRALREPLLAAFWATLESATDGSHLS